MNPSQYIFPFVLFFLGGILSIINGWNFLKELMGKRVPSTIPFIGGIFLFIGAMSYPETPVRYFAWVGLLVDFGCLPYLTIGIIRLWLEMKRYSIKNCLLSFEYEIEDIQGSIHVYLHQECIVKYRKKDNSILGSMVMKVLKHTPDTLELGMGDKILCLSFRNNQWKIEKESVWSYQA